MIRLAMSQLRSRPGQVVDFEGSSLHVLKILLHCAGWGGRCVRGRVGEYVLRARWVSWGVSTGVGWALRLSRCGRVYWLLARWIVWYGWCGVWVVT